MYQEEVEYKILKSLNENPKQSQRELAKEVDLSLGKVNFCIQALLQKGSIKVNNFKNSKNKIAYFYRLTPHGIEQRAKLTVRFLKRKMTEYDDLKSQIDELEKEVQEL